MIAISYRREDSLPIAGRLYDRLQAEFGRGNVFMDFDSIPYGVDFREHIKHMIDRSKVLVAMIGPDWFGRRRRQPRRIDDPADFVRLEIAYALQRGIPVVPVLINDTPMPKASELPADIEALAFRNAVSLDVGIDFHHHADRLVVGINRLVIEAERTAAAAAMKQITPSLPPKIDTPFALSPFQEPHPLDESKRSPEKTKTIPPKENRAPELSTKPLSLESTERRTETPRTKTTNIPPFEIPKQTATLPQKPTMLPRWQYWSSFDFINRKIFDGPRILVRRLQDRTRSVLLVLIGLLSVLAITLGYWIFRADRETNRIAEGDLTKIESVAAPAASQSPSVTSLPAPNESSTAERLLAAAIASREKGDVTNAFVFLEAANKRDPENAKVLAEMADIHESNQSFDQANKIWSKIREIGPSSGSFYDLAVSKLRGGSSERKAMSPPPGPNYVWSVSEGWKLKGSVDVQASPALSPATSSSLTRNSRTWQAWIDDFVRQFVSTVTEDVDREMSFFAADVGYFGEQSDQARIRQDIENYRERWPIRRESINGEVSLVEVQSDKEYTGHYISDFYAESPERQEWSKGECAVDVTLTVQDGAPKISAIQQKMLQRQKGKLDPGVRGEKVSLANTRWTGSTRNIMTRDEKTKLTFTVEIDAKEAFVTSIDRSSARHRVIRRTEQGITWDNGSGITSLIVGADGATATVKSTYRVNGKDLTYTGVFQKVR